VKLRLGAALGATIVLVGMMGAPTLPVMIGITAGYAWLLFGSPLLGPRVRRDGRARLARSPGAPGSPPASNR